MYTKISLKLLCLGMGAVCTLIACAAASAQDGFPGPGASEKAPEFSNAVFNREEALRQRARDHAWLMSEAVVRGLDTALSATFSATETGEIDNAALNESPVRVGLIRALSHSFSFSDVRRSHLNGKVLGRRNGALRGTSDGGYVFTSSLSSPGATGLRVQFSGFSLADNAELYLFTEDGQVFGPYTGRGPFGDGRFWSHTLMGDYVILQLRHKGSVSNADLAGTRFQVTGLGHLRPRFLGGHCGYNAPCVENATCGGEDPAVDPARTAVAHMQWVSGPFIYMCTGGLLADTNLGSTIPWFLTANHCISRSKDARSLENFFQLTAPCGTTSCDDIFDTRANHPQSLRTLGATVASTGSSADYTLLRLKGDAPAGSTFLGWNSSAIAFSNNPDLTDLYRISHPQGAPQAYSEHIIDTSAPTCGTWPRGPRIYSRDVYGATEGGSSGSPVLNSESQVVGQLSGACGYDPENACASQLNATVDGAFANYFSSVRQYLCSPESCNDGIDNDCDGAIDADDSDCGNSCTPAPEICDDGIDNDCDGFADLLDSDCDTGGGGDLLGPGESCSNDSECLSGRCKGRRGVKVCL